MKICIVTPAPPRSRLGNRVTALRWARMLRELGHRVVVTDRYEGAAAEVMFALHAKRSAAAAMRFRAMHPGGRLVVALTGTDLYRDLPDNRAARRSLALADRIVVLQPMALERLSGEARNKARVLLQSVPTPSTRPAPSRRRFEVAVVGHLRAVKDPFRAAMAARALPEASRIVVLHAGAALDASWARRAVAEQERNPRYRWLGERPRHEARRLLARARVMVLSSLAEGGSHVVAEALVAGTPVLASAIDGNIGQLGGDYPGLFEPRDTRGLTALLSRVEQEPALLASLTRWCRALAPDYAPAREKRKLAALMRELD